MKPGLEEKTEEAEKTVRGLWSALTGRYPEELDMSQPTIYQIRDRPNKQRSMREPSSTDVELYEEIIKLAFLNHNIDPNITDSRLSGDIVTPRQLVNYIASYGKSYAEIAEEIMTEAAEYYV